MPYSKGEPLVSATGLRQKRQALKEQPGKDLAALRLVDTKTTTTGVVIATYQPAEPTAGKTT